MVDHSVAILLYRNAIAIFCAASIGISPVATQKDALALKLKPITTATKSISDTSTRYSEIEFFMRSDLWHYLRGGINYLEASGKEVPTQFKHPGGTAYGPLALTQIAIEDVRIHNSSLSCYTFQDVLKDRDLYEKFAALYAALLLKHYLKLDYLSMGKEEAFGILQRAWFLGPSLYKKGQPVIASREVRAREYVMRLS